MNSSLLPNDDQDPRPAEQPDGASTAPAQQESSALPIDLGSIRLSQDFAALTPIEKPVLRVQVQRPDRQAFVRVHPAHDRRLDVCILELKRTSEVYLVAPHLAHEFPDELALVTLYQAIDRQGTSFLWPVRLPTPGENPWVTSVRDAAHRAMSRWVRVCSNRARGAYDVFEAVGELGEPQWPARSFADLVNLAFKDHYVKDESHDVLRELRGQS